MGPEAELTENQLRAVLSTRRLIGVAEIMEAEGLSLPDAFRREFYGRLELHERETLKIDLDDERRVKRKADARDVAPFGAGSTWWPTDAASLSEMHRVVGQIYGGSIDEVAPVPFQPTPPAVHVSPRTRNRPCGA